VLAARDALSRGKVVAGRAVRESGELAKPQWGESDEREKMGMGEMRERKIEPLFLYQDSYL
jgi:hypothetical protein